MRNSRSCASIVGLLDTSGRIAQPPMPRQKKPPDGFAYGSFLGAQAPNRLSSLVLRIAPEPSFGKKRGLNRESVTARQGVNVGRTKASPSPAPSPTLEPMHEAPSSPKVQRKVGSIHVARELDSPSALSHAVPPGGPTTPREHPEASLVTPSTSPATMGIPEEIQTIRMEMGSSQTFSSGSKERERQLGGSGEKKRGKKPKSRSPLGPKVMGLVKSFSTQTHSSPLNKERIFEFGLGLDGNQSMKNVENFSPLQKDPQNSSAEGEKLQVTRFLGSERENVLEPSFTEKAEVPGTLDSAGYAGRGRLTHDLLPTQGIGQERKSLVVISQCKNAIQV